MTKQEQKTPIEVKFKSHGHWTITSTYRRVPIIITTTDSKAVDNFNDDNERTHNKGYNTLRTLISRAYAQIYGHY
jgi:hypothetical protein